MAKQIYVVNNRHSILSKNRGIISGGNEITVKDFNDNQDRFNRLIEKEIIILKENYTLENKKIYCSHQFIDGKSQTSVNLRHPSTIVIPEDVKNEIDKFVMEIKIPENKRRDYDYKKLKQRAYTNFQEVCCMLNNLNYQKGRIKQQGLDSTKRMLKNLEEEINFVPNVQRITI